MASLVEHPLYTRTVDDVLYCIIPASINKDTDIEGFHMGANLYYELVSKPFDNIILKITNHKCTFYYHLRRDGRKMTSSDHPSLGDIVFLYKPCNALFERSEKIATILNNFKKNPNRTP